MKKGFAGYHPLVNMVYFLSVLVFALWIWHPVGLLLSFLGAFCYAVSLSYKKALRFFGFFLMPLILLGTVINALVNHRGITILAYLPNGNPLTKESILYGCFAASLAAVILLWFFSYSRVMTSDKFIYLFGRILPSFSLVISMTMRFVPRFGEELKEVSAAQNGIGKGMRDGNLYERMHNGLTILSILISRTLEGAVDTADSMKSRGYGTKKRTAFSIYRFTQRDTRVLCIILAVSLYLAIGVIGGAFGFSYYPMIKMSGVNAFEVSLWATYAILCFLPVGLAGWEVLLWKATA